MNISVFVPTTTSTTTTEEPCFIVDCEGDFIIDCECNGLSCGDCEVECYIVDCQDNTITDCLGDELSCGECGTTSSTTTQVPVSTTTSTTLSPITTSSTTTSGGDQDLINYMLALGIPYDNTVYYEGTPQEITGIGLWDAVSNLIEDLKDADLWDGAVAIYPYVGGTADRHKYNLKSPYILDKYKRLIFNGAWTHSATGATPTTNTSYAQTFIYLVDDVPQYSFTGATYYRNIAPLGDFYSFGVLGNIPMNNGTVFMILNPNGNYDNTVGTHNQRIVGNTGLGYTGLMSITCFRNNVFRFYKNTTLINSNSANREYYFQNTRPMDAVGTITLSGIVINTTVLSPAVNCERAFDYFGQGMDTAQHTAFNNAVSAFQTALNRNV